MKEIVILGAGGFAREASLLIEEINENLTSLDKWKLLGFIDEDQTKWGLNLRGYPVLGGWEALVKISDQVQVIGAVGNPEAKRHMIEMAEAQSREFATLIHPEISLSDDVNIGKGSLINKGCIFTTNISVGSHVSVNPGCGIGHDTFVDNYTTLMWHVNISGMVIVGKGCLLGTGSTILQGKKVGDWSIVGAGAVVTRDLPPGCTAVGVPAKVVKK